MISSALSEAQPRQSVIVDDQDLSRSSQVNVTLAAVSSRIGKLQARGSPGPTGEASRARARPSLQPNPPSV
jgi:hypothetical protein